MTVKIGINGFGRIGRNIFRAISKDPEFGDIEVVAINDLTDNATLAHLLQYDSIMGIYEKKVESDENGIIVDGRHIAVSSHRDPIDIPWGKMGVEYVAECTGIFRDSDSLKRHIDAGARKVILSAPAKGDVKTFVMGVNEDEYDPTLHHVVSNASCTTNCLAPLAQVILDNFGIKRGLMTTIHAYTGDQRLLDFPHSDLRRARAAGLSMIPTKTGAAAAVALVIPALKGKFDGLAVRVPTPNVSLVDVVMEVERETTVEEVNQALKQAANKYLGYTELPLVSIDFQGDSHSSIIDAQSTKVIGTTVKVMSWYDNEWGYSNRMLDLILHMEANKPL
ncbi:MAG: type I glyceraldehyde-3-phosphate dehydrogenase [Proteobacteria bacterium]|jgi:glyceraldehyde 3-phosphate dehydrogenase|nr:type I glyceraldehyde-3-phosphate dehydrogenase [Desulfocapsa sp.]MBU3943158.1 type I glyceraldehyde-3-phosphate dehydrogenase [Pseudomonadota bacterium]MCG2745071.1 type I glyceraldehyde-3-phosphate dehydrogenase [Desulfobacteraceae bacterium]MDO8946096.1 type I glyceraldehyde-3-phosphate dehydrogenase [Desulfocapsaceae bacterium]MBU3984308.1 type I glyceraldehyde-3-phosphate dehydrogenase [Pseudomonadota bacterium]